MIKTRVLLILSGLLLNSCTIFNNNDSTPSSENNVGDNSKGDKKYTITWVVDQDKRITTVLDGQTPKYGSTPTKARTAEYTYTFVGWNTSSTATSGIDIPKATQDQTYYAIFSATKNKYKITFKVEGVEDKQIEFEYGVMPDYGMVPTKESTIDTEYYFSDWNPKLESVSSNATYTAVFKSKTRQYTITYALNEDIIVDKIKCNYNTNANSIKEPSYSNLRLKVDRFFRFTRNGITYDFNGWETKEDVKSDKTYYATGPQVDNPESKTKYFGFTYSRDSKSVYTKTLVGNSNDSTVELYNEKGEKLSENGVIFFTETGSHWVRLGDKNYSRNYTIDQSL